MGGCGRGICIWLETIILENVPRLHVVIVWLNDLRLAEFKRCMEMNKGNGFITDGSFQSDNYIHCFSWIFPVISINICMET